MQRAIYRVLSLAFAAIGLGLAAHSLAQGQPFSVITGVQMSIASLALLMTALYLQIRSTQEE